MSDQPRKTDDVTVDALFDVLSIERRRIVLGYLLRQDGPVEVEELIDHVVAESQSTDDTQSDDVRLQVFLNLHHVHLPKMDDVGLADYDRDRETVELTDAARGAEPFLELSGSDDS